MTGDIDITLMVDSPQGTVIVKKVIDRELLERAYFPKDILAFVLDTVSARALQEMESRLGKPA